MSDRNVNTLFLDEEDLDNDEGLIAVYSPLEIYRFAYYLNRDLNLNLRRTRDDIELVVDGCPVYYPLYHYSDKKTLVDFYLIANGTRVESKVESKTVEKSESLFEKNNSYFTFLVPEEKYADYFLKVEGTNETGQFLSEIKLIERISAAYPIDISKLKSYTNLIFE